MTTVIDLFSLVVFAIAAEAVNVEYNCNSWKNIDGHWNGWVFSSDDMTLECEKIGKYN